MCIYVCGDIVFYKLRSKSETAIEHNITIYLMAKYCKIYHLYYSSREREWELGPENWTKPTATNGSIRTKNNSRVGQNVHRIQSTHFVRRKSMIVDMFIFRRRVCGISSRGIIISIHMISKPTNKRTRERESEKAEWQKIYIIPKIVLRYPFWRCHCYLLFLLAYFSAPAACSSTQLGNEIYHRK